MPAIATTSTVPTMDTYDTTVTTTITTTIIAPVPIVGKEFPLLHTLRTDTQYMSEKCVVKITLSRSMNIRNKLYYYKL